MITHLTGRAREWATAEWARRSPDCDSKRAFSAALHRVFGPPSSGYEAARALSQLRQGRSSITDHAIRFRTLVAESGWNDRSLADTFFSSLSEELKDRMAIFDLPTSFEALVALASKVDNRLRERERQRVRTRPAGSSAPISTPTLSSFPGEEAAAPLASEEPMQVGSTRLPAEERQRRIRHKLCIYCGGE